MSLYEKVIHFENWSGFFWPTLYNCYICGTRAHYVYAFRSHLQTHLVLVELTPLTCPINVSRVSVRARSTSWVTHVRQFHVVVDCMLNNISCHGSNTDTQADTNDVDADIESNSDLNAF